MKGIPRDGLGLGLRPPHVDVLSEGIDGVDFIEIVAENFAAPEGLARARLGPVASRYPVVAHGVSLNVMGVDPIDDAYLELLAQLADTLDAPAVTDHLCWSQFGGVLHHDLLPGPAHSEVVPWVATRVRAIAARLGRPFGLENVSSYLRYVDDDLAEWELVARVAEAADCGLVLDVNNVYVSSLNQGFDPDDYLRAIPWDRVLYVHVAGHVVRADGLVHDTHDAAVADAVWALYARAWRAGGPFPTVLEWDDKIPPVDVLVDELRRARGYQR